jgi:hypothetical protein
MANSRDLGEQTDNTLLGKLEETRTRYRANPTVETHEAYRQAFRIFANWIIRGELPDNSEPASTQALPDEAQSADG